MILFALLQGNVFENSSHQIHHTLCIIPPVVNVLMYAIVNGLCSSPGVNFDSKILLKQNMIGLSNHGLQVYNSYHTYPLKVLTFMIPGKHVILPIILVIVDKNMRNN